MTRVALSWLIGLGALAVLTPSAHASCDTYNKQKALYANFEFEPSISGGVVLDMSMDVIWGDLDDLRAHGSNGIYMAFMLYWPSPAASGYMGVQVTGAGQNGASPISGGEQVLFSLWDRNPGEAGWQPALPMSPECSRNCNDCGVHEGGHADDGSTGTQCKTFVAAYSGQHVRIRVRRVDIAQSAEYAGQSWTGDVWEVSLQDTATGETWTVGRQLLAGVSSGLSSTSSFYEHIGCTECDSFDFTASARGPWVLDPPGYTLSGATSTYSNALPDFTCLRHGISSSAAGEWTFFSGPSTAECDTDGECDADGTWSKSLFSCTGATSNDGSYCFATAAPPLPPPAPPTPPPPPSTPIYNLVVVQDGDCADQYSNLGTGFLTPSECWAAAQQTSGCGESIAWAPQYYASWGCRCCVPGDTGSPGNANWQFIQLAASPSSPPPAETTCQDTLSSAKCEKRASNGKCGNDNSYTSCMLTCNLCKPECENAISFKKCQRLFKKGKCHKNKVQNKCKATCRVSC